MLSIASGTRKFILHCAQTVALTNRCVSPDQNWTSTPVNTWKMFKNSICSLFISVHGLMSHFTAGLPRFVSYTEIRATWNEMIIHSLRVSSMNKTNEYDELICQRSLRKENVQSATRWKDGSDSFFVRKPKQPPPVEQTIQKENLETRWKQRELFQIVPLVQIKLWTVRL